MSEEDHHVDVGTLPKFDMPLYTSKMTAKDVKSLSLRYVIPLDLHPISLTKEWTMAKLPDDMIACAVRVEPIDHVRTVLSKFRRAILDAIALRHHDSDINDPVPEDDFNASDFQLLTEQGGLATTWDFPGFHPTFKDTEGNEENKGCCKEKGEKREGGDGGEGSRPKTKRKKTVVLKDNLAASEATSSPRPIRTFDPNQTNPSDAAATTIESQEDRSPLVSPRGSAAHPVNYTDAHRVDEETDTLRLGTSGGQSGKVLTNADTEVVQPSLVHHSAHHSPPVTQMDSPLRSIQRGNVDKKESNTLNNATALDRAWFSLARGALAQTDILKRFEHLQTDFDRLAEEHAGCKDTELEDLLAKKDSALVYAERINAERALEKEKLVIQLGKTKMEKFNSIRKLLPTMVEHLLQSHEYKKSLSEPFNSAIQAGWDKGLTEERSEEDLLELIGRMEGFDVYADKKINVEYNKLFEKLYPYVEKISHGFRHFISDLLKVYPDSPFQSSSSKRTPFW
ncbi:hypothetical protein Tco_0726614 [Tanacetum coccineum]|uniref:Uncharacterized protein n=1 Tax=Tanacetum coccineum TaxID=301880 RepID=A0ABQ4YHQ8_9ASTR